MRLGFQAEDIRKIVAVSKDRYEYIAGKIGIIPEVDEFEESKRLHLYSFKNLLEFAFSSNAYNLGVQPKVIGRMLDFLDALEESESLIYDTVIRTDVKIYYISYGGARYFQIYRLIFPVDYSAEIVEALNISQYLSGGQLKSDLFFREQLKPLGEGTHPGFDKLSASIENFRQLNLSYPNKLKLLDASDGYVVLNLGRIKRNIQLYLDR
jgi:hypothetical protein